MRLLAPSALVVAAALAILPGVPQSARAGTAVVRCAMPDGSHAYTNAGCGALGGTTAPMPATILNRIEREARIEAQLSGAMPTVQSAQLATMSASSLRLSRGGCAASPQQLALELQAAVASGDVNRVAESYDWNGMRNVQAQRVMRRLEQLATRRILSIELLDARMGGLGAGYADAGEATVDPSATGMLHAVVDTGDGAHALDFSVQRDQGCYFVRY